MSKNTETMFQKVYDAKTPDEHSRNYAAWADTYDEAMKESGYVSPPVVAGLLSARIADKSRPVLDVGCGTGIGGVCLNKAGFQTIDGIDLSPEMMEQARAKDVYRNLVQADLTQHVDIPDGAYAGAYSTGTFTLGHIGPDRIPEVMRMIEPHGLFALTVSEQSWAEKEYETVLKGFEKSGVLAVLDNRIEEHVVNHDQMAHILILGRN